MKFLLDIQEAREIKRVKAIRNKLAEAMMILRKAVEINPRYEQKSKSDPVFEKFFKKDPRY